MCDQAKHTDFYNELRNQLLVGKNCHIQINITNKPIQDVDITHF